MKENIKVYKGHRFPEAVISHAVWLYYRFSLSFREVEEVLAARGVIVSHETIRQWCLKFPSSYAKNYRAFRDRAFTIWQQDTCAYWPGLE